MATIFSSTTKNLLGIAISVIGYFKSRLTAEIECPCHTPDGAAMRAKCHGSDIRTQNYGVSNSIQLMYIDYPVFPTPSSQFPYEQTFSYANSRSTADQYAWEVDHDWLPYIILAGKFL